MPLKLALALTVAIVLSPVALSQELVLKEDFSNGMAHWWVEGGERTWIEDGSLHMKADPAGDDDSYVATAWLKQELPANVRVSLDAQVISSSRSVNNINIFLHFSDPKGVPLYETRESRASASYPLYHDLNGYIFTFLVDPTEETLALPEEERPGRIRIRRCPGFELVAETYGYHNTAGRTYRIDIVKSNGELVFSVDGQELLRAADESPHGGGLIGLRTFRTYLQWSNIKVINLD